MRGLKLRAIRDIRRLVRAHHFKLCIAHRFKPTYVACLATGLPVIGVSHAFGVYRRRFRQLFASAFRKRLTLLGVSMRYVMISARFYPIGLLIVFSASTTELMLLVLRRN